MFPNGWPGRGLLLLRLTAGLNVLCAGLAHWFSYAHDGFGLLVALLMCLSILLILGLWTPIAGVLLACTEAVLLVARAYEPRQLSCLIGIHLAVAMLGPGGISIDAAIFGRYRLDQHDL